MYAKLITRQALCKCVTQWCNRQVREKKNHLVTFGCTSSRSHAACTQQSVYAYRSPWTEKSKVLLLLAVCLSQNTLDIVCTHLCPSVTFYPEDLTNLKYHSGSTSHHTSTTSCHAKSRLTALVLCSLTSASSTFLFNHHKLHYLSVSQKVQLTC